LFISNIYIDSALNKSFFFSQCFLFIELNKESEFPQYEKCIMI